MSDPVWLPDVLRRAGLRCDIAPGAFERGHGDFGEIWGVLAHHTGANNASWQSIAFHPSLGLASQLHLDRTGLYTLCGVGLAWHAGNGAYPGVGVNNGNRMLIGIEAANDGGGKPGQPHRSSWPDVQYDAYVRGCAAIVRELNRPASHVIAHKEWAGSAQGKWDPGAIDMATFRRDIAAALTPTQEDDELKPDERQWLREIRDKMMAYPDVPSLAGRWPSRARCRRGNGPIDDTVGMILNNDANLYDLLIAWSAVTLGDPFAVETVRLGAEGRLPANDPASVAWFRSVAAKLP